MDRDQTKQKIEELVKKYRDFEKTRSRKDMDSISEANVRADFIDPLFEILGWDISDPGEYDREHFIRGTGFADVALKLKGEPVVFIEAKRFGGIPHIRERGDGDWTMEERQAILYAARSNCKWAILTNFERFRVFNAATGLTILNFEMVYDYLNRFPELLYLTKDSVESGRIEKLAEREEKPDIDLEFLGLLNRWRVTLANDIYKNNFLNEGKPIGIDQIIPPEDLAIHPARGSKRMEEWIGKRRKKLEEEVDFTILKDESGNFDVQKLKSAVQRILDRLIIIRWAEDHLITDDPNILFQKLRDWKTTPAYNSIVDLLFADRALFDKFNDIHNGRIFARGHICEKVKISDEVLGGIIEDMSKRSFRKFDFDILGNTYETYLGHTLHPKEDGTFGLKPSQETRKESGIYYTPPYVVDYIVKHTLGVMLAGKTPDEVSKIRVLDPACGSGSFLIKTFDYFSDYYRKENEGIRAEKERRVKEYLNSNGNQLSLDFGNGVSDEYRDVEYDILVNNLHGVDLDEQACEIAAVNLMLKGLRAGGRMPLVLGETIKTGNSLISGGAELSEYFGDGWKDKKPFNWEEEFGAEGFDVVVGNPPYFGMEGRAGEQKYFENNMSDIYRGKNDVYYYFIAKGIDLLNDEESVLGYITERYFLEATYADKIRNYILNNASIKTIIDFGEVQIFPEAGNHTCIIVLKKRVENSSLKIVKVKKSMETIEFFSKNVKSNERLMNHIVTHIEKDEFEDEHIKVFKLNQNRLYSTQWILSSDSDYAILNKINLNSWKLIELCTIEQGQKTGLNSVFAVTEKEITSYGLERTLLKELIKNSDIGRYIINCRNKYLIYTNDDIDIEDYPNTKKYFEMFKDDLLKRAEVKDGKYAWYRLQRPRKSELFEAKEKLVVPYRAPENRFGYDNRQCYNDGGDIRILAPREEIPVQLKYVLSILNSKLLNYYYRFIGRPKGDIYEYFVEPLSKIPIHKIDFSNPSEKTIHDELVALVNRMLPLHKQLHEINTDFDRYLNLHPRVKDSTLKEYVDALPIADKEVLKDYHRRGKPISKIEGKIKEFEITEKGEWLVFRVGYLFKNGKGKETISRIDAFKCRIEDVKLRKFLYYSIKEYTRPGMLGRGNIYERLLAIRLPRFYADAGRNAEAVSEIMTEYLAAVDAAGRVEREIAETDQEIDARVYALYGLDAGEIRVVEG